jgi:hypothetical protein
LLGDRRPLQFSAMAAVAVLLAAKVWTYWISIALVGGIILSILGIAIGYVVKVMSMKYPKQ